MNALALIIGNASLISLLVSAGVFLLFLEKRGGLGNKYIWLNPPSKWGFKRKNKKAWIRIVEAFVAVMMVMTVMLIIIQMKSIDEQEETEKELSGLQTNILKQVSMDDNLRSQVLNRNTSGVEELVSRIIPSRYNYTVRICNLGRICEKGFYLEQEVFTEESVISANLTEYSPKVVKLFWWEGAFPQGYNASCGNKMCDWPWENLDNCAIDCVEAPSEHAILSVDLTAGTPYDWTNPDGIAVKRIDYTAIIKETNGVSVLFDSAKRCYIKDLNCDSNLYCDVDGPITPFTVDGHGQYPKVSYVYSSCHPDKATITYFGEEVDNPGFEQSVGFEINFP